MVRLAADENFNGDIVRGMRRRKPDVDVVRVQDDGLEGFVDPDVLAWAAAAGRVLVTHDVATMSPFAYERVAAGLSMPGVLEVSRAVSVGEAIEELLMIVECSRDGGWEGQVRYLPLR